MIVDTHALSAFADKVRGGVELIGTADELYVPVIVLGEYRFDAVAGVTRLSW